MQRNDEIKIFCDNVRLLRKIIGLSKKEMARRIRISVASLNKLESGILPPRLCCDILIYINREFGVTPSEMFQPRLGLDADTPLPCHPERSEAESKDPR